MLLSTIGCDRMKYLAALLVFLSIIDQSEVKETKKASSHSSTAVASSKACPNNIRHVTGECFLQFDFQWEAVKPVNFFTGVDVEIIRSLCSSMSEAMSCVQSVSTSCSQSDYVEKVQSVVDPYLPFRRLCVRNHLYEDYAMNQNCYYRTRHQTSMCYETFLESLEDDQTSWSSRSATGSDGGKKRSRSSLKKYCGQTKRLVTCVRTTLRKSSCGKSSIRLTDDLVRASLPLAHHCNRGKVNTSPTTAAQSRDQFSQNERSLKRPMSESSAAKSSANSVVATFLLQTNVLFCLLSPIFLRTTSLLELF